MLLLLFNRLMIVSGQSGAAASARDIALPVLIVSGILLIISIAVILLYPRISRVVKWFARVPSSLKTILAGSASPAEAETLGGVVADGGYAYDARQHIFYSRDDAWQRRIGYCRLYDEAAALTGMIIDCEPVTFEYGGKKWLIEFWKGQYGMMTGCEAGVYCTTRPEFNIPGIFRGTFYDCAGDDDMLHMACVLYKNGRRLFYRSAKHWWLTGFVLAEFSEPSELVMDFRCTLKDSAMRDQYVKALLRTGYQLGELNIRGNSVALVFDKPRSPQPYTRTPELERLTQARNKFLCDRFNDIAKAYKTLPEGLSAVREADADIYEKVKLVRGSDKMLKIYKTLSGFSGLPLPRV